MSDIHTMTPGGMLDRYELISLLARGGMGSVWLARLPGAGGFQRLYAIKVMHPHLAEEGEFVHMLLDEARIAARIHHPNAVPIVDVCKSDNSFYLVMDYIEGVTVAQWLALDLPWKVRVRAGLRALVDGLAGLHAAHDLTDDDGHPLGIVHRDVSPQNLLVGSDGTGRITDFGIALAASRIVASRPGLIKGKPSYMSPEQVSAASVDRRADVFAMGIVLWEVLAGRRLFDADQELGALMQVVGAVIEKPSTVKPDVPASLDEVCMTALQRDPAARFATARAMGLALESAASAAGLLATSHELADLLREHFAEPFAARRALVRDHAKGSLSAPRVAAPSAAAVAAAAIAADGAVSPTVRSASIPAIEVNSRVPMPVPPSTPPGRTPSTPSASPLRRAAMVGVPAVVLGALVAVVSSRREAPAPTSQGAVPHTLAAPPPAVSPLPAPSPVAAVAAPPPAVPEVVVPPVVAPVVVPVVVPAPAVTAPAAPARATRRVGRDAGASSHPAIEENPYLQR